MAVVMQRAEIMRKKMRAESGTCQVLLSEYKCSKCMDSEVVFYEEVNEFGMSKKNKDKQSYLPSSLGERLPWIKTTNNQKTRS